MGFLAELASKYKTVSIVGMAKNAGKTTALNFFIEEAMDEGLRLAITSTGRDGEAVDLVTATEKPRIWLDQDTLVSVPTKLYELAEAGLEIVRMTKYHTSIGDTMICRVAESGYVQVAGPVTTADQVRLSGDFLSLGAELVLIDGAIDRKSIAAPESSDAIILSSGAVISRRMERVVEETAHVAGLYALEKLPDGDLRRALTEKKPKNVSVVKKGEIFELELKTGLSAGGALDEAIDEDTEAVYIPGALTKSVIEEIHPKKLRSLQIILKDPTKIFVGSKDWQQLRRRGLNVSVLENIRVAAVTVNPWAPGGYSFDHKALKDAMQAALPDIPIIDVRL